LHNLSNHRPGIFGNYVFLIIVVEVVLVSFTTFADERLQNDATMLLKIESYRYCVVALVLLLLTACINDEEDSPTTLVNVGDTIPAFSLSGSDGKNVSSSSLSGRVYILNFFDTTCPDCQKEFKVLQRIHDKYGEAVPVLNVPRSQTKDEVQAYWSQEGLTMPFYMASDKDLYYKFATRTIPRTYVVDGEGKARAAFTDSPIADFETLDNILQQLSGRYTQ
jgi:peroxiredoxin